MAMQSLTQVAINFYTHAQAVGLTLPSCPRWGGLSVLAAGESLVRCSWYVWWYLL